MGSSPARWVAVVGPGAIGAVIAASLKRAGREVALVARDPGSAGRIARGGLTVVHPSGRPETLRSWESVSHRLPRRPGCEAVFLCVKAPDLPAAIRAVRHGAPAGPVVSLLNGLGHEVRLRRAFGPARAVMGSVYIAGTRTGERTVRHWGGRTIQIGATPKNRAAAARAAGILSAAGWDARVVRGEERVLWTKIVGNAAINPLGALLNCTNGELAELPPVKELLALVLREAAAVARAAGHRPLHTVRLDKLLEGCRAVPEQFNSMAQDLAAGRKTESGAILKPLIDSARRTRTPAPLLSSLYAMILRLEGGLRHVR